MPARHIRKFVGELTEENFERVASVIFEDAIVGLDLLIDRDLFDDDRKEGAPKASAYDEKIILSRSTLEEGGIEININEAFSPQWGTYRVDGIFSVKSGGMFQGIVCVGLIPTDEALVRLNPEVRIIDIKL
ncbi:hypothetical protein ACLBKU_06385 [Erythrobacter sp. NE805]|uniref:hypothetical protein n=1 Tax=Erythrobacter sp. NE805 TaxID=3389875 RepID=UPI00396B3984